ncbi:hypothetical protein [Flavobacterium stagni]|uniref:Uncharacterized protein n=1 Tax=Flavobacterium stagni TaxID=2506421 RepID=A0A4Q1K1L8_9FLAO|nr:hypothetical protein [Flavobacterium stagni]RXR18893.1 hypothetical protein EQG61_13625 [Flavobacterium stagni]
MSGVIYIENQIIFWSLKDEILCRIPLNKILAIGELTFESLSDDYFMIFILEDGSTKQISFYADNFEQLKNIIAEKFKFEFRTQLANSIKWKSALMYPLEFSGIEIFPNANSFTVSDELLEKIRPASNSR